MKRKLYTLIPVGIILLFIVTNPSVKDFKDYLGYTSYGGLHRTSNWFIFSTYKTGEDKYLGFFGNFIEEEQKPKIIYVEKPVRDSVVIDSASDPYAEFGGHTQWHPPIDTTVATVIGHTSEGLPIFKNN